MSRSQVLEYYRPGPETRKTGKPGNRPGLSRGTWIWATFLPSSSLLALTSVQRSYFCSRPHRSPAEIPVSAVMEPVLTAPAGRLLSSGVLSWPACDCSTCPGAASGRPCAEQDLGLLRVPRGPWLFWSLCLLIPPRFPFVIQFVFSIWSFVHVHSGTCWPQ